MIDHFSHHTVNLTAPAAKAFAITPDDTTDLPEVTRALYVGTSGDLAVQMADKTDIVLANVPAGTTLPLRVRRVKAASTAAHIVGLA